LIEANIDDLNPELYEHVFSELFKNGALDVYLTPIQMKKNRPALKLSILSSPERVDVLTRIIFQETSTIGVRCQQLEKRMLFRRTECIPTPWGKVRIKVAEGAGGILNVSPEYEDCKEIALRAKKPLKEVYKEVEFIWRSSQDK
jgi:uncharacterized protein (DUF111 family)